MPGFSLEGIKFGRQTVVACDIAGRVRRYTGISIGGIIGYDFLSRFVTRIDYEARTISFFHPDSFTRKPPGRWIEAPLLHRVFSLECELDGEYKGVYLVDTGANRSMLQPVYVERNNIPINRSFPLEIMGAGGKAPARLASFDSLKIGDLHITRPVMLIAGKAGGISSLEDISGILGNDILEKFVVTLDYTGQKIMLEKTPRSGDSPIYDKSGLILEVGSGDDYYVYYVIPGSPAFEAGLRKGDRIMRINGRKASSFDSVNDIAEIFTAGEGTVCRVTVERSGGPFEIEIVLKDYLQ
jgi:hypothetical protein